MEMYDYLANVIVTDLVSKKEYVINTNVNAIDAERIVSNISNEILLTDNNNKVSVRFKLIDKVNTIQLYKNVVDKVLEVIDSNKRKAAAEECIKKCENEERKVVKRKFLRKKDMKK